VVGLTRSELIERLIGRTRSKQSFHVEGRKDHDVLLQAFDVKDCDLCVRAILGYMASSLVAGRRIEIRGFGSFAVNLRPARVGRNPKTGDSVLVPEKKVPHFKCGKDLKLKLNGHK
jgi:integration host factor subunit beta